MQKYNAQIKKALIQNYKNLSISETGETTSIMLITHKNKSIDFRFTYTCTNGL